MIAQNHNIDDAKAVCCVFFQQSDSDYKADGKNQKEKRKWMYHGKDEDGMVVEFWCTRHEVNDIDIIKHNTTELLSPEQKCQQNDIYFRYFFQLSYCILIAFFAHDFEAIKRQTKMTTKITFAKK